MRAGRLVNKNAGPRNKNLNFNFSYALSALRFALCAPVTKASDLAINSRQWGLFLGLGNSFFCGGWLWV